MEGQSNSIAIMCVVINVTLMYNFQIKGKIKIMGLFTGNFYSKNLRMTTQINVIFPDVSNDVTPLYEGTPKVLYLLHGLSGNSDEWTRFSKIEYYAKKYNFIIIMPEVQRSFTQQEKLELIISIMLQMNFQLFVGNGFIWIKDEKIHL